MSLILPDGSYTTGLNTPPNAAGSIKPRRPIYGLPKPVQVGSDGSRLNPTTGPITGKTPAKPRRTLKELIAEKKARRVEYAEKKTSLKDILAKNAPIRAERAAQKKRAISEDKPNSPGAYRKKLNRLRAERRAKKLGSLNGSQGVTGPASEPTPPTA
jgi:hypothetical protein